MKRGKIGPRLLLMTNMEIAYSLSIGIPKSMTLNDLERPFRILFQNTCVFGAHHKDLNVLWSRPFFTQHLQMRFGTFCLVILPLSVCTRLLTRRKEIVIVLLWHSWNVSDAGSRFALLHLHFYHVFLPEDSPCDARLCRKRPADVVSSQRQRHSSQSGVTVGVEATRRGAPGVLLRRLGL